MNLKKTGKIFSVIIIICVCGWLFIGLKWDMFGFTFCDEIYSVGATVTNISKDEITMNVGTSSSFFGYVGHVYVIENKKLYLGLKFNAYLGVHERLGDASIIIPCNTDEIEQIILRDAKDEKVVWEKN